MNAAITRVLVGCICSAAALMAVACGDGNQAPTAPGAGSSMVSGSASARTGGGNTQDADFLRGAGPERPFRGSLLLEVTEEPVVEFPFLSVQLAGTGQASHLGRFTATMALRIDISKEAEGTETSTGSIVLTAANGDTVIGTISGAASVNGDNKHIVETVTVTGGTGRFAGATGEFVITRDTSSSSPSGFEGTIRY